MILHIVPQFHYFGPLFPVLLSVQIPEWKVSLVGDRDLVAHKNVLSPRPEYSTVPWTVCRKGEKTNGFLVLGPQNLTMFRVLTSWALKDALGQERMIVVHEVEHLVMDTLFSTVTDVVDLWFPVFSWDNYKSRVEWADRRPDGIMLPSMPVLSWPDIVSLDTLVPESSKSERSNHHMLKMQLVRDPIRPERFKFYRKDAVWQPTVEPFRLNGQTAVDLKLPDINNAFECEEVQRWAQKGD